MNYEDSAAYMSGLLSFGMRLGRDRFAALLGRVGDPHRRLRCIHVAGTNGKGSTTTFIASVLQAAGYTVGAYLSPYVFDLRERIQINGRMIPRADFARWVTTLRSHIEAVAEDPELGQTTEFELKTAVAFCWLAEQNVDFAVIEVGIGGQLDATNVIPPPLAAVITNIGLDHTKILGNTVEKIAAEKAGILKPGTGACVTAVPPGPALAVIAEKARNCGVPLLRVAPEGTSGDIFATYRFDDTRRRVHLQVPGAELPNLQLSLHGPFQAGNAAAAAAAVAVLRRSGVAVGDEALRTGLESATLPGRFQIVRDGSEGGPALVLDVAHNDDGARVLADALRAVFPDRRVVLVVGMSQTHEPESFLRTLAPRISRIFVTAPLFRPRPVRDVAAAGLQLGMDVCSVMEPAARAIRAAWHAAQADEVVVVTGSFYTVGETPPGLRGLWSSRD